MSLVVGSQLLLRPVVALVSWTFVMEGWMYLYRLPAISKYNVNVSSETSAASFNSQIPRSVQWPADNYNNLMEQPTQFYAIALALNALGANDQTTLSLAWTYVGLRIIHSVVQATKNRVMIRFQIFVVSSLTLLGLTAKAALIVFGK